MARSTAFIAGLALLLAACGAGASSTATPAPVTPAPVTARPTVPPTPVVTPAPAPTPAPIAVAVTFDGKTCTYAGPTSVPVGTTMVWSLTNTPAALKNSVGSGLMVLPVVNGTTWDEIVAYTAANKASNPPPWSMVPGTGSQFGVDGLGEAKVLYPEDVAAGDTLSTLLTRNAYYVGCHTSPTETDHAYPALLLRVVKG
jgi:hypothetical protein